MASVSARATASASASAARRQPGTGAMRGGATTVPPPDPRSGPLPTWDQARDRALGWIEGAGELGIDSLVFVDAAGALSGEPRVREIVAKRRAGLSADELARYGKLLDAPKPAFAAASLDGVRPSASTPNPDMDAPADAKGGNLIDTCLSKAVRCSYQQECLAFATSEDRWGYVLTHQGAWLLVTHWSRCRPPFDVDARRASIAANLVKEMKTSSKDGASAEDLFIERLAVLGHLGFAKAYEPAWVAAVRGAQETNGCWRVAAGQPCSAHTTALALLTLAHARAADLW